MPSPFFSINFAITPSLSNDAKKRGQGRGLERKLAEMSLLALLEFLHPFIQFFPRNRPLLVVQIHYD